MTLLKIVFGVILLLTGRRLFWFFVGVIGFLAGFSLTSYLLPNQPAWLLLGLAILAGVIGALMAVFLQNLAILAVGFLAGGYLLTSLLSLINWSLGSANWLPFVLGGILGAALMALLFEWALIILSALIGADLIVQNLSTTPVITSLIFLALLLVGVFIQARSRQLEPHTSTE